MKQYEAVIKVMEENGGYATLGYLNQKVLKVPNVKWVSKTPFASIRRIVQDSRFFFKIKPGLWALNSHKEAILPKFFIDKKSSIEQKNEFNHTYYQGLLVEIGNMKGWETYIPPQDKNKIYLNKPLKEVVKTENIYEFSYSKIINHAKTIDVIWFNERRFPNSLFEVEYSTDFVKSLLKFVELQDFYTNFYVVSDKTQKRLFDNKIDYEAFRKIKNRVIFWDYEFVSNYHTKIFELDQLKVYID